MARERSLFSWAFDSEDAPGPVSAVIAIDAAPIPHLGEDDRDRNNLEVILRKGQDLGMGTSGCLPQKPSQTTKTN